MGRHHGGRRYTVTTMIARSMRLAFSIMRWCGSSGSETGHLQAEVRTVGEHDFGAVQEQKRADGARVVCLDRQDAGRGAQVRLACDQRRSTLTGSS